MSNNVDDLKDVAAESSVISSLLTHPEYILHTDWLKANHFSQKENGAIYWAIGELYKKGITNIDVLNLNNQLASNEAVKKLMTTHNLTDISRYMELAEVAARDTLEEYLEFCKTVVTYAYKRTLYFKTKEIERSCFNDRFDLDTIDKNTHMILNKITEDYMVTTELKTVGERSDDLFEKLKNKHVKNGYGVPSKFEIFSKYFRYDPGELVVVASRMKSGKSALLLNEAIDKALQGCPTLVIDTELSDELWYERALTHLSQIAFKRIDDGNWSKSEEDKILLAKKKLESLPLVHYYMPIVDMDKAFAICKILKYKMGLKFLCFDYIKGNGSDAFALSNKMGEMTDILHNEIAGTLGLSVLAACQLNKQNEISSSDKIAMYASTIVLWRFKTSSEIKSDGGLSKGNIYTQVHLNRNGSQQNEDEWMNLYFNGDLMTITDCEQNVVAQPFGG